MSHQRLLICVNEISLYYIIMMKKLLLNTYFSNLRKNDQNLKMATKIKSKIVDCLMGIVYKQNLNSTYIITMKVTLHTLLTYYKQGDMFTCVIV